MPLPRSLANLKWEISDDGGLQAEQAGRHDCWEYQEARFKVPAEDRALPHRTVPTPG